MNSTPRLSVLIVNWNGLRFLDDCLSALRRQSYRDFETIMVDNGSEDGSVQHLAQGFPEVKVLALPTNIGFQAANNLGLEHASGELVVLLNNDTEAHPQWLENLARAADQYPEAGSFASKMLLFHDRERIDNCGAGITAAGVGVDYGRGELDREEFRAGRWVFSPCAGAAAYRKAMLREIGFFDADFFMTYEDLDLAFRSQLHGYKCRFVPEAVVYHHYRGTMGRFPARQVFYSQRSVEWVYMKNMPAALALAYLPQRILYEVGSALYFIASGCGWSFLSAKASALAGCPKFLAKRGRIQRGRRVRLAELREQFEHGWIRGRAQKVGSAFWGHRNA